MRRLAVLASIACLLLASAAWAAGPWLLPGFTMRWDPSPDRVFRACVQADPNGDGTSRLVRWRAASEPMILRATYSASARERAVALDVMMTLRAPALEQRALALCAHPDPDTRGRAVDVLTWYATDHGDRLVLLFARETDHGNLWCFLDYFEHHPNAAAVPLLHALAADPLFGGRARRLARRNESGPEPLSSRQ